MIYLIIAIIITCIAAFAAFLGVHFNNKRYASFVAKNSKSLKLLLKTNLNIRFHPYRNFDQSYNYDNENYYNTISCEDFLIYQLQYQFIQVTEQIEKVNQNKIKYKQYSNFVKGLPYGQFFTPIGKLKQQKLLKTDRKICKKAMLKPPTTQFNIKIKLYCTTLKGEIRASKKETFSTEEIITLINRLRKKTGEFYHDRGIWDAICRVERGKVSNKMRFEIFARDGNRCRNCGISGRHAVLEIDHIIPISKGGKSTYDNLQTLCHNCNVEKGNKL